MASLSKIVIFRNTDGTMRTLRLYTHGQRPGESETDYITRTIAELKDAQADLRPLVTFTKDISDIRSAVGARKGIKRKLRISATGLITIDESAKTPKELYAERRSTAVTKLKSLGLTDTDISAFMP